MSAPNFQQSEYFFHIILFRNFLLARFITSANCVLITLAEPFVNISGFRVHFAESSSTNKLLCFFEIGKTSKYVLGWRRKKGRHCTRKT